jgi:hypothetical protein
LRKSFTLLGSFTPPLLGLFRVFWHASTVGVHDPKTVLGFRHDAMGRTLLEMNESAQGIVSLRKAIKEFKRHPEIAQREIQEAENTLKRIGGKA